MGGLTSHIRKAKRIPSTKLGSRGKIVEFLRVH